MGIDLLDVAFRLETWGKVRSRVHRQDGAWRKQFVRLRRGQITLRWIMARIAVALAFLVAAARQSQRDHCSFTFNVALEIVVVLAVGYPLVRALARAMARAYR
jgi:hypothetical protein